MATATLPVSKIRNVKQMHDALANLFGQINMHYAAFNASETEAVSVQVEDSTGVILEFKFPSRMCWPQPNLFPIDRQQALELSSEEAVAYISTIFRLMGIKFEKVCTKSLTFTDHEGEQITINF